MSDQIKTMDAQFTRGMKAKHLKEWFFCIHTIYQKKKKKENDKKRIYQSTKDIANCIPTRYTHVKYSKPSCFLEGKDNQKYKELTNKNWM